jgi:hypothetical protein
MKKLLMIAALIAALVMPEYLWAAGSCVQTAVRDPAAPNMVLIKFVCTGDSGDGSIPNTDVSAANMALILNKALLYSVTVYPTSGGTAPDAADVSVYQAGVDLLGAKGVNLIHATATQHISPYSTFKGEYYYPAITGTVQLRVANQATASANYTIELQFLR